MKKIVKIIGLTILAILILLIVIPIFFKDKVLKVVTDVAGHYVDADINIGNLDLSLLSNFPGATVVLDDVSIVGRNEFKGDTLAAFDNFELTMNVMSLFGGKIKVKSVERNNPKVNIIVTKQGKCISFSEEDVRPMGRNAGGVHAIDLGKNDEVVSMELAEKKEELLVVTKNGFGKRTPVKEYIASRSLLQNKRALLSGSYRLITASLR